MPKKFDDNWKRNSVTGCHNWKGRMTATGHGRFEVEGVWQFSHVIAWERNLGVLLKERQGIEHTCENPACVNTDHMIIRDLVVHTDSA